MGPREENWPQDMTLRTVSMEPRLAFPRKYLALIGAESRAGRAFNTIGLSITSTYPSGRESHSVKRSTLYAAIAVVVVVALGVAFAISESPGGMSSSTTKNPTSSNSSEGTTSTTNSYQAGNQTYVATLVSTMESAPSTSTTVVSSIATSTGTSSAIASSTTTGSTSTTQPQTGGDSYSYSPSSQVKILSVEASVSSGQPGSQRVIFEVSYQNIGSGDIYVFEGGGSSLNVTALSSNLAIQRDTGPRCEIAAAIVPLSPGAETTAVTPGCWSGFYFQLLQPGSIQVLLTLGWSNGTGKGGGSVEITGDFGLS